VRGVQRLGLRECAVTLVICPGDRAFRVATVAGPGGVLVSADAVRAIEAGVDLRLASKGEADIGSLVTRARWGHFAELPQLNTTRFTKRERRVRKGVVAAKKGKVLASA
jgi:hypothetical protein